MGQETRLWYLFANVSYHAEIQRVAECPDPDHLINHKSIGFLSNTGLDALKNHKAAKPAFRYGPSSACQRNAI